MPTEQYPDTTGLRHADARTAEGDFQAGPGTREARGTTRLEGGKGYKLTQRGGNTAPKAPIQMTPHHRMGVAEMRFVFTGNTAEQNATIRSDLTGLGEAAGNQDANYEATYDGAKSSKAVGKTGIFSYDHKDIHDLNDQRMKDMGFTKEKGKLMFNGVPADELPFEMKRMLSIQMALQNDQDIDDVQRQRGVKLRQVSKGESYAQRKDRILNNPQSFANDPKRTKPVPVKPRRVIMRNAVPTFMPQDGWDVGLGKTFNPKEAKALIKKLSAASLLGVGALGTAADAAETGLRAKLAAETKNPVDALQAAISAASTTVGATGVGEILGIPLEVVNMLIDQHRSGGAKQIRGRSGAKRAKLKARQKPL